MKPRNSIVAGIAVLVLIISAINVYAPEPCNKVLSIDITNNNEDSCTNTVVWEVQTDCEGDYAAISCDESQELTIAANESKTVTCTTGDAPTSSGPHCVRIEWCDGTEEFIYGEDGITGSFDMEFVPLSDGGNYGWMCDNGCSAESCGGLPYKCKTLDLGDYCTAKGFDYGACGGTSDSGGYCYECMGGCDSVGDGGSCGTETCTASKSYCCRALNWGGGSTDFCVAKNYDCGCCGGLDTGKSCIRQLSGTVTNNGATDSQVLVTFWVDEECGGTINDSELYEISAFCHAYYTGEYDPIAGIALAAGETETVSCSTGLFWPPEWTGEHCWRAKWDWS